MNRGESSSRLPSSHSAAAAPAPVAVADDPEARLTKLKALLDKGLVTQADYDSAKAEIIKKAFFGPVTPEVPASILQMHPDFTLVGDEEALSLI